MHNIALACFVIFRQTELHKQSCDPAFVEYKNTKHCFNITCTFILAFYVVPFDAVELDLLL